jgi:cytochrome c2
VGRNFKNLILISLAFGLGFNAAVEGQETALFFKQNCSSCHWIGGGRLIGPDLKNVAERKDRDWLVRFILDPKGMLDARDPYAIKLQAEAKGAIMIQAPGINAKLANTLLDLIEAESKLDSSQFAGKAVAIGPYSEADAAAGMDIFTGRASLKNNGRSCISCHTVNSVGSSLGGRLGPDLTGIFDRLQGRTALTAWLAAPPTPTMKSIFQSRPLEEDELKSLVAYFESAAHIGGHNFDSFIVWISVVFCGLGGGVFGIVLFGGIWGNRFRAVRRPLVKVTKIRGES